MLSKINLSLIEAVHLGTITSFRDWADSEGVRTHIVVNADAVGVMLPANFTGIQHLSIGSNACRNYEAFHYPDGIELVFDSRFTGKAYRCHVPLHAIVAIASPDVEASTIGLDTLAQARVAQGIRDEPYVAVPEPTKRSRSHLTVVK